MLPWTFVLSVHIIIVYIACSYSETFRIAFSEIFLNKIAISELIFI
jgi:hypothetical protein